MNVVGGAADHNSITLPGTELLQALELSSGEQVTKIIIGTVVDKFCILTVRAASYYFSGISSIFTAE